MAYRQWYNSGSPVLSSNVKIATVNRLGGIAATAAGLTALTTNNIASENTKLSMTCRIGFSS